MLNREFSRREKTLLTVFAILMLILLYYFLVDKPVRDTMEDAQLRLVDANSQIELDSIMVEQMHEMQAALDALDKDKVASVPDFENERKVVELLNRAMLLAGDFNMIFHDVMMNDIIVARPIDVRFTCTDYSTAERIMNIIHDGPYFCEISSAILVDKDALIPEEYPTLKTGLLEVTMTVTFYEYVPLTDIE